MCDLSQNFGILHTLTPTPSTDSQNFGAGNLTFQKAEQNLGIIQCSRTLWFLITCFGLQVDGGDAGNVTAQSEPPLVARKSVSRENLVNVPLQGQVLFPPSGFGDLFRAFTDLCLHLIISPGTQDRSLRNAYEQ